MKNRENGIYNRIVKRIIDLVLSALIMLILSPLLLLLVLAIKLDSKGPVLFRQKRVGAVHRCDRKGQQERVCRGHRKKHRHAAQDSPYSEA